MLQVVRTYREFREFLAAKKSKREPIRWNAKAPSEASYVPKTPAGFSNFRAALRGVGDWGKASEKLDSLADALWRRHSCHLPLPRRVMQNSDRSLTLFWEGLTVRVFEDGIFSLVGGAKGTQANGTTTEILDMLAFQSKVRA